MHVQLAIHHIPRGLTVYAELVLGGLEVVVDDCGFQLGWPYRRASLRAWSCGVRFWSVRVGRTTRYWSADSGSGCEVA